MLHHGFFTKNDNVKAFTSKLNKYFKISGTHKSALLPFNSFIILFLLQWPISKCVLWIPLHCEFINMSIRFHIELLVASIYDQLLSQWLLIINCDFAFRLWFGISTWSINSLNISFGYHLLSHFCSFIFL